MLSTLVGGGTESRKWLGGMADLYLVGDRRPPTLSAVD